MLQAAWNNPAGGLRYHVRALWHRSAWLAFRDGLLAWLSAWRPGRTKLALVGPSAGHCLPFGALDQFERFVVFEIDPVARFILKRRMQSALPGREVVWVADDQWIAPVRTDGQLSSPHLDDNTAVLFCNFIGQVPYMLEPGEYTEFQKAWTRGVFPWLAHTPWASFHDRVSGDIPPYEALPSTGKRLEDAEIAALYEADPRHNVIELNDHRSQELLPGGYDYRYLHWPLTPTMHHVIECVLGGPKAAESSTT